MGMAVSTYQEELERTKKILADPERTLSALIFSTTGRIICRITRRKEPLPWQFSFIALAANRSNANSICITFT